MSGGGGGESFGVRRFEGVCLCWRLLIKWVARSGIQAVGGEKVPSLCTSASFV